MAIKTPDPRDPDTWVKVVTSKKDKDGFGQTVVGHCTFPDCNEGKNGEPFETRSEALSRKEKAYNEVHKHVRLVHLGHPEMVSTIHRHRSGKIEGVSVVERERVSFDIVVPTGRMVQVTYGKDKAYGVPGDLFETRYRSTDISAYAVGSPEDPPGASYASSTLYAQINHIEKEFQGTKAVTKARKEIADHPEPATLMHPQTGEERTLFEEVLVRGIDQRSGNAMITRADGSKESVRVSKQGTRDRYGSAVTTFLARELDPNDRVDIRLEWKKWRTAAEADPEDYEAGPLPKGAQRHKAGTSVKEITGPVPLSIRLDTETYERVAFFEDREYRGATEAEIERAIVGEIVTREGYRYQIAGNTLGRRKVTRWTPEQSSYETARLFRTRAEAQEIIDLQDAADQAKADYLDYLNDYAFDLSLLMGVEDDQEGEDDQERVPAVQAPEGSGDWDPNEDLYEDED